MKRKAYISGPMTGLPGLNFPAFHEEALRLRRHGLSVVNPAELNPDPDTPREKCMLVDVAALCTCTEIVMLPGHENSRGAALELLNAQEFGFPVYEAGHVLGVDYV